MEEESQHGITTGNSTQKGNEVIFLVASALGKMTEKTCDISAAGFLESESPVLHQLAYFELLLYIHFKMSLRCLNSLWPQVYCNRCTITVKKGK